MTARREGWDWWSEVKLQILRQYLHSFTTAVRGKSSKAICLDLFAGTYDNPRRHETGTFPGSVRIALETDPAFTRIALFELPAPASSLEAAIRQARPTDNRWRVFSGDCNDTLDEGLRWLDPIRWAPTFAFLDPRGLQVAWTTIERLATWRADKKTKVEQWILLPEPALARVLGLSGAMGRRMADRLDRVFGVRDWAAIHQLRRTGKIGPEDMRAEFVNLLRWRLEKVLAYRTTHALQLVNTAGQPIYTMIFATDSSPGDKIMAHVYNSASTRTIPAMQERAQAARERRSEQARGVLRLPGLENLPAAVRRIGKSYDHTPPWEPPLLTDDALELSDEADIDPDEIDADRWADELEGNEESEP
jgi:three-Cys-motif partner protein